MFDREEMAMCDRCGDLTDEDYSRWLEENIQTYGWTMTYVPGDGGRNPAYGYTVGLSQYQHPEIITFESEPCYAFLSLKPLAWAVLEGTEFDEGDDLTAFFPPPQTAELLRFPDSELHLRRANAMYRRPGQPPLPALQLVWPSRITLIQPAYDWRTCNRGVR
ncbi:DUF4262 domain-containing protein [Kribbella sp.]|uniref:DUF4262 domain-containing protein n=1 Tax=Kribbella sp. TaxID=1871183 RepID=UPI002D2A3DCE|nr:DUF4262 domain-containing protein [Kribbella sp.]HZX08791.1 DUF4262 domain-containing protein [Kribbella sp.]